MGEWLKELADARAERIDPQTDLDGRRAIVARAAKLSREVTSFQSRWPEPTGEQQMVPQVSWMQLERQLADLADTPVKQAMARDLVSGTRKMARFKPPEMVLREILCLAWALLDESFQPQDEGGSAEMT